MTDRLLVGFDGSACSRGALTWALHEAARRGWAVRVVSCYHNPVVADGGYMYAVPAVEAGDKIREAHEASLAEAVEQARRIEPDVVVEAVLVIGAPVVELADRSESAKEVVVGTRGASRLVEELLGSTATGVMHHATCPFVAVPTTYDPETTGRGMSRIVVGIDGSPTSDLALAWAHEEAALTGATLVVLHAWSYPYVGVRTGVSEPRDEMKIDASTVLDETVAKLTALGSDVPVEPMLVEEGPSHALLQAAESADLVVMGSRGRGGFRSLLLGSVTQTVVQHAVCPVVVIHRTKHG